MSDFNSHIVAAVIISCTSFGISLAAIAIVLVTMIGR